MLSVAFCVSFVGILYAYIVCCTLQRHKQRRAVQASFHQRRGTSLSSMTLEDAWAIQTWLAEQEFPKTLSTAVFFALFKTYGIPSIAMLLTATGHMTRSFSSLSRRVADTGQLLNNVIIAPPRSRRSIEAIVRTAWIHRSFRSSGKISDEDMLYTLSLFALEGQRWVERYEWRRLTDLELCAIGVFWRQIGQDLDIPSTDLGIAPHANGLEWLRSLDRWSRAYEKDYMAPHPCNHMLAVATMELLGAGVPSFAKRFVRVIFCHLMGPELRHAMNMPAPPPLIVVLVNTFFRIRKFLLQYLALPRSHGSRKMYIATSPSSSSPDHYHALRYRAFPWYVESTTSKKIEAWLKGSPLPGPMFHDQGYKILDLGPDELRGEGYATMREMEGSIRVARGVE